MAEKKANGDQLKRAAGERAAEFVADGMTIGLGTGSTVYFAIRRIGALVAEGMRVRGVPTSVATARLAAECGIPLVGFDAVARLDLALDGADEISPALDLVKGAGGALLREKLVAEAAAKFIVVADESKLAPALGRGPVPVEIVPFAFETTRRRVEALGCRASLRARDGRTFVTDNGNYIFDCRFAAIDDAARLDRALKLLTGVVETGLFVGRAALAVVAGAGGVALIERPEKN